MRKKKYLARVIHIICEKTRERKRKIILNVQPLEEKPHSVTSLHSSAFLRLGLVPLVYSFMNNCKPVRNTNEYELYRFTASAEQSKSA